MWVQTRPIPFAGSPRKWITMQLQLSSPVMQYIQKYKANKLYSPEKLQEGWGSQMIRFYPDWDLSRAPENDELLSQIKTSIYKFTDRGPQSQNHFHMSQSQYNFLLCSLLKPKNCIYFCVRTRTDLCLDIMPNSVHSTQHTPSNNCTRTARTASPFVF